MKKYILILIAISIILTGCGKKLTWQDVESSYNDIVNYCLKETSNIEEITKQDYTKLLTQLNEYIDSVKYSQDEENQVLLKKTYETAQYISAFASMFDGNCAQQLISLAGNAKDLVMAEYGGDSDQFAKLKESIKASINEISTWSDEQWAAVEKQAKILWESVAKTFEDIEDKEKDNLTSFSDIAETELEDLKHTIIDNYELIKDGITENNEDIAKGIYSAAVKLEQYTKKISTEKADAVWQFAKDTQSFIKSCYGKVLEESEALKMNYDEEIAAAKKWTQSTWNEITRELKLLVKESN